MDGTEHRVIPRDYALDPVSDKAMHVDFLRIGANTRLNVNVAVHFINQDQSPGIKKGGVLNIVHHTVELNTPAELDPRVDHYRSDRQGHRRLDPYLVGHPAQGHQGAHA